MTGSGLETIFGNRTDKLRSTIVRSSRETHEGHAAGQRLMDPEGRRGYGGSIWVNLPNNLCDAVQEDFVGASVWRGPRSSYSLPVLDGCILYAWRIPGGKSAKETSFLTSGVREQLVAGVPITQLTLFEGYEDEPNDSEAEIRDLASEADADRHRLIVIVVESTPERLHTIKWSEARRGLDADLEWFNEEVLYTFEEDGSQPVPVPEHTFADGQPPAPIVIPRIEAKNSDE